MLLLYLCLATNQSFAQSIASEAAQHHEFWQESSEGVVIAHHAQGKTQYDSAGLTRLAGDTPDENTLFEIGSITKVFTAILLAEAVRENRATFDDVVSTHLTEVKFKKSSPFHKITLTQLATHTSGLPREPVDIVEGMNPANPVVHYTDQRLIASLIALHEDQLQEPGEISYSNYGMGILGYVLTQIYDQTFADLLKEKIFIPLEMNSTTVPNRFTDLPEHIRERIATGHYAGEEVSHYEFRAMAGASAMISSAKDLIQFGKAHWDGTTPEGLAASLIEVAKPRIDDRQGLGWSVEGGPLGHTGLTGGFRSQLVVNPNYKTVRVFLSNSGGTNEVATAKGDFSPIKGFWSGIISTESKQLRLVSFINGDGRMVVYNIDRNNQFMLSAKSSLADDQFYFTFPSRGALYKGTFAHGELLGSISFDDSPEHALIMQYSDDIPDALRETMQGDLSSLKGYWWGYLGGYQGLFVYISISSVGELPIFEIYAPDESSDAIGISFASLNGRKIYIRSEQLGGEFTGEIAKDRKSITGVWTEDEPTPITLHFSEQKPRRE